MRNGYKKIKHMKLSTFLTVTAIIYIVCGIAMILFPYDVFGLLGFDINADGAVLGRVVGAAIIGMGLMNFVGRNESASSSALKGILIGNMVYHALDVVFIFIATYTAVLNEFSWGMVGFHAVLTFGFAYYVMKKS